METIRININSPIKDNLYYEINTGLSLDADDIRLGDEDAFGYDFIDDLKSSLVPDVIDMERIKFVPGIVNGSDIMLANKLNFYLHFIKRKEIPNDENEYKERALNSVYTSGNVYYDTWHIDSDKRETTWWNEYDNKSNFFNEESFSKFYENNSKKSDLIGYLNFTDNDIFYRKKKVSQSFIRLLFYNSPDPIEQKLLYYSTIFLDGGELYGKYIKQLVSLQKEIQKNASIGTNRKNENAFIVMYSGGTRVDSKISVTHEYDKTKSAEGFNLYLFKENYSDITGQTIYMKVEFNHAGNGKTTPLIIWPKFYWDPKKENEDSTKGGYQYTDKHQPLTTENFIKSLYTEVRLHYDENSERFIYSFPNVENEDGDIEFILYEPKLDMVLKDVEDGQHDSESQPETPVIKPKYNVYFIDKKTSHVVKSFKVEENTRLGTLVNDKDLQDYITELSKTNIVKLVYVNGGNDIYEDMLIKKDVSIYIDYKQKEIGTVKYYVKIVDDTNEDGIFDYTVVDGFYDEGTILGDIKILMKLGNKNILGNHINTNVNSILLGAEAECPSDLICVKADTGACGTKDMADICPLDETCKDDLCLRDNICLDNCNLNNICDCSDNPEPCIDCTNITAPTGCTAVSITPTGCTSDDNDTGVTATTLSEYISQISEGGYVIDLIDDNDNIIDISTTVTKDLNLHIRRKREESEEPIRKYILTFTNDGQPLEGYPKEVEVGFVIVYPVMEEYVEDNIKYTFKWDDESYNGIPMPEGDITINGKYYDQIINCYVKILDDRNNDGEYEYTLFDSNVQKGSILSDLITKYSEPQNNNYQMTVEGYINILNRDGYTGTLTEEGTNNIVSINTVVERDYNLYIDRAKNKYKLSFIHRKDNINTQGEVILSEMMVEFEDTITYPPILEDKQEGDLLYFFEWEDLSYDGKTMPAKDVIIYGKYNEKRIEKVTLTFTNKLSLPSQQIVINDEQQVPNIAVYNNYDKILELKPGETSAITIDNRDEYKVWLSTTDLNGNQITPEYYYCCQSFLSGETFNYHRPIMCNGQNMNSDEHGLKIGTITSGYNIYDFIIREYNFDDFDKYYIYVDENYTPDTQLALHLSGRTTQYFNEKQKTYQISSDWVGISGLTASVLTETIMGISKSILGDDVNTLNSTHRKLEYCEYDGSNILGAEYCDYDTCGGNCPYDCSSNCGTDCQTDCGQVCELDCDDCPTDYCPDCPCNACNYPDCNEDAIIETRENKAFVYWYNDSGGKVLRQNGGYDVSGLTIQYFENLINGPYNDLNNFNSYAPIINISNSTPL